MPREEIIYNTRWMLGRISKFPKDHYQDENDNDESDTDDSDNYTD